MKTWNPISEYGEQMPPSEMIEQLRENAAATGSVEAINLYGPKEFTREDLFRLHAELTARGLGLMQKKNADYSHTGPFQNFSACEAYGITAEDGLITRMSDKLSRLASI